MNYEKMYVIFIVLNNAVIKFTQSTFCKGFLNYNARKKWQNLKGVGIAKGVPKSARVQKVLERREADGAKYARADDLLTAFSKTWRSG